MLGIAIPALHHRGLNTLELKRDRRIVDQKRNKAIAFRRDSGFGLHTPRAYRLFAPHYDDAARGVQLLLDNEIKLS